MTNQPDREWWDLLEQVKKYLSDWGIDIPDQDKGRLTSFIQNILSKHQEMVVEKVVVAIHEAERKLDKRYGCDSQVLNALRDLEDAIRLSLTK